MLPSSCTQSYHTLNETFAGNSLLGTGISEDFEEGIVLRTNSASAIDVAAVYTSKTRGLTKSTDPRPTAHAITRYLKRVMGLVVVGVDRDIAIGSCIGCEVAGRA